MSARGWVNLCQHLLSHPLHEARSLGEKIREEMQLVTPRLLRHAVVRESIQKGQSDQWQRWVRIAREPLEITEVTPRAHLRADVPEELGDDVAAGAAFAADLESHDNRYGWIGDDLKNTVVRFGWDAVALAEIRDLNRHRTGTKICPLVPVGFYASADEWPDSANSAERELAIPGENATQQARARLAQGDATGVYWCLLGTQFRFDHVTTADKFLYEAELRTGTGAHYRYARHLREALGLWYERFPATRGLVLEGGAEPE
jgi:hypothetical protein